MDYKKQLSAVADSEQQTEEYIVYSTEYEFAKAHLKKQPILIELLVDSNLAKKLCDEYESVSRYKDYRGKWWVRIVAAGQLADDEISDLITHSAAYSKE